MYTLFLGFNAGSLAGAYAEVGRASGASQRLLELMNRSPTLGGTGRVVGCRGDVELEGVDFSFPSRQGSAVLRGLSLKVGAGERVALVGPSGVGKSTVSALLCGLYAPQKGRVTIDGVEGGTNRRGAEGGGDAAWWEWCG